MIDPRYVVLLDREQIEAGEFFAAERNGRAYAKGARGAGDSYAANERYNVLNALASLALSLLSGQPWDTDLSKGTRRPHVGPWYVTGSPRLNDGLLVKKADVLNPALAEQIVVLGLVEWGLGRVSFPGWIHFHAARRPEFWRGALPRPAFIVPQAHLHPMPALFHPRSLPSPKAPLGYSNPFAE